MPLSPGTRFGPYEVVAPIGAGGMGEVYRARDTRLERSVALKVLPAEFAEDARVRIRFEREAKAISQLEHPNICRLYDVGEATFDRSNEGRPAAQYLVMELLDGKTLADRLQRGPLPVEELVQIGREIAAALHAAHRRGIVHRDLKPGNVMLTKSGAKLLDFGLARAIAPVSHDLPTERLEPLTSQNVIVGTIAYMSPEQVNGEELDARSDIFSFGIVLYEMANGRRPFTGGSVAALMHAIAESDPPPIASRALPPALAQIIRRCLEKNRDDRFQSAADAAFALSTVLTSSNNNVAIEPPRRTRGRWAIALGALALVTAGALAAWSFRGSAAPERIVRFKISFPAKAPLALQPVAISPDGSMLAYVRVTDGTNRLYLRSLSALGDAMVNGSEDAQSPFFSPDASSVAFVSRGKLKRLRIGERDPVTVADVGAIGGATWGPDGTIVFASLRTGTLFRVSDSGGSPLEITKLDRTRNETEHVKPQFLPSGHTVSFLSKSGFGPEASARVEALDLRSGHRDVLIEGSGNAQILAFQFVNDVLLFASEQQRVRAVRIDFAHMRAVGSPVTLIDDEALRGAVFAFLAAARNGTLVYASDLDSAAQVVRVGGKGRDETLRIPEAPYLFVSPSPDEQHLALTSVDRTVQMNMADLERGTVTAFGPEGAGHLAVWTHDGSHVIYSWAGGGPSNLISMRADGSGEAEAIVASPNHQDPGSISPDGKWLAYAERDPVTNWDIWLVPLAGARNRVAYLRTQASEYSPAISPDGKRVAYTQVVRGGAPQVFVDSFPAPRQRTLLGEGKNILDSA